MPSSPRIAWYCIRNSLLLAEYGVADLVDRLDLKLRTTAARTFNAVNWRGGAVYTVRPDFTFYGQYSTATDAVSNIISMAPEQQIFDLTPGTQVEVGTKNFLWNGRGEWTLAGYRIVKRKLLIPDPNNPLVRQQVGQQSSRGIEISAGVTPFYSIRIDANAGILQARYDDFTELVNNVLISRNGRTPTNIPQQVANLWVSWHLAGWQFQTGLRYVGSRFQDNANTVTASSYRVADGSIRRRLSEGVTMDIRASNLFDTLYSRAFPEPLHGPPASARLEQSRFR